MNFASSIYSKLEPRIEDEIRRTTTTEGRSFFVSETRPIIRDVLFSRGKTRALFDIRWVASGGTRRRAKRRRSFSDLGINCKLVYRPQRTLGCWFIRRVVAAFASSSPSSLRSPFNSGSPVPSRPSNSRAWPTTKHPPFANGNCRKFHRILPRLASSIEPPLIRKSGAINVYSSSLSHRSSTRRGRIRSLLQEKTL